MRTRGQAKNTRGGKRHTGYAHPQLQDQRRRYRLTASLVVDDHAVPRRSSQSGVAWAQGSARREFRVRSVLSESHWLLGPASRTHARIESRITSRTVRRAHRKATLWRFCAFGRAKCACFRLYLRKRAGHAGARTSERRRQSRGRSRQKVCSTRAGDCGELRDG